MPDESYRQPVFTEPEPTDVRGSDRLCPYCGGKLSQFGNPNDPDRSNGIDPATGKPYPNAGFCCRYQREAAESAAAAAKRSAP